MPKMYREIRKPDLDRELVKGLRKWIKIHMPWFSHKWISTLPGKTIVTQNNLPVISAFKLSYKEAFCTRKDMDIIVYKWYLALGDPVM